MHVLPSCNPIPLALLVEVIDLNAAISPFGLQLRDFARCHHESSVGKAMEAGSAKYLQGVPLGLMEHQMLVFDRKRTALTGIYPRRSRPGKSKFIFAVGSLTPEYRPSVATIHRSSFDIPEIVHVTCASSSHGRNPSSTRSAFKCTYINMIPIDGPAHSLLPPHWLTGTG